jgi:hypothetical protein
MLRDEDGYLMVIEPVLRGSPPLPYTSLPFESRMPIEITSALPSIRSRLNL